MLLTPGDETIYERCKMYFEKYVNIKHTLKHNNSILHNMKINNKILKKKNKQLEKDLDKLANENKMAYKFFKDEESQSEKDEDQYEMC